MQATRLRRCNSSLNITDSFPVILNPEIDTMEIKLKEILENIAKTDRRHLGSILGGSALAILGFVIFSSATIIGGIVGGVLGFGIGHVLGRR